MSIESITGASDETDLNVSWPQDNDFFSEGAGHIRILKVLLQNLFENGKAAEALTADTALDADALGGKALASFMLNDVVDNLQSDLNTITNTGFARFVSSATNAPVANHGMCFTVTMGTRVRVQLALIVNGDLYWRAQAVDFGAWTAWDKASTLEGIDGTAINPSSVSIGGTQVIQADRDVNANRLLIEGAEVVDSAGLIDWTKLKNKPTIGTVTGRSANRATTSGSGSIAGNPTYETEMNGTTIRLVVNTHYTNCVCTA